MTDEQKERISKFAAKFKGFLETETGKEWAKERDERLNFFGNLLGKEHIDRLTEEEFKRIIKTLWAFAMWVKKDYVADKIVSTNGFDKIRSELKALIYDQSESLDKRFDRFKTSIKGLGVASITEILVLVAPDRFCVWYRTPMNVLPFLKMERFLPKRAFTQSINGSDYVKCNEVLGLVREELNVLDISEPDYYHVDHFLYYLMTYEMPAGAIEKEEVIEVTEGLRKISRHEEAEGVLLELGNLHGFRTYTADQSKRWREKRLGDIARLKDIESSFLSEDLVDIVKEIDVIWFKDDMPEYCFEVEHTTNVREGLLRLYQISPLRHVKFFIIAPPNSRTKFEKEVTRAPFKEIKERYIFQSYDDLVSLYNASNGYFNLRNKFGIE